MKKEARIGMLTNLISRFNAPNVLPGQLYNIIRNDKNKQFENEIENLYQYTQKCKGEYDIIWKNDNNNKFDSLLMINSRIKYFSYARDIVVINNDTECTNRFHYPFLYFHVSDENNKVQMLAISIMTSKEEISFTEVMNLLKLVITSIRIFIVDRLIAQIEAIK